jgi:UDP-2,4-diacetamido-2,4,6-trideoxy-beta-L-altropyranose hydrolase
VSPSDDLLIRADASPRIGTGHVMRCLALAQAWKETGGQATFLSVCDSEGLRCRIEAAGAGLVSLPTSHPHPSDLEATLRMLAGRAVAATPPAAGPWLVLDGYQFDPDYAQAIRRAGYRLLIVDDNAPLAHYHADLVLNQNIHAGQLTYRRDPDTRLLLGTRYVLLRTEFAAFPRQPREVRAAARRVLVTLGGSDPENVTAMALRALEMVEVPDLHARVVAGPANPHLEGLREAGRRSQGRTEILTAAEDLPALMDWAEIAVSAGGSTCWELAFMGVPNVILVLAENQLGNAAGLAAAGVSINMGQARLVSAEALAETLTKLLKSARKRRRMGLRGHALVDGRGAERVSKAISCQS